MLTELRLWYHNLRVGQLHNAIAACEASMASATDREDEDNYLKCYKMRNGYERQLQHHVAKRSVLEASGLLPHR